MTPQLWALPAVALRGLDWAGLQPRTAEAGEGESWEPVVF